MIILSGPRTGLGQITPNTQSSGQSRLTIFTYTAEPGSSSEDALKLLGSWAATIDPAEPAHTSRQT